VASGLRLLPVFVDDDDDLFRWVHKEHHQDGKLKPGAFILKKKNTDGLSIGIGTLTTREDFHRRAEPQYTASVALKAEVPRGLKLIVLHDGRGHPSHGVITGFQQGFSNKQLIDMEKAFIKASENTLLLIKPDNSNVAT
jgi:hypothetical protein